MTLLSLSLITLWMVLVVLGVTFAGFVHVLLGAAVTLVVFSGRKGSRRVRTHPADGFPAAAATAAAATAASAATTLPIR